MNLPVAKQRWFRFSLRTLFAATTLLAVFIGWATVQLKWVRDRREAIESLAHEPAPDVVAPWSIRLFEQGVAMIHIPEGMAQDHAKLQEMRQLFPEARLYEIVVEMRPGSSTATYVIKEL